jgi:hypothetical protein
MSITVYGASGDLIEVEGDVTATFHFAGGHSAGEHGDLLAFSDGTILSMRPDPEYAWVIDVLMRGEGDIETWTHTHEGDQARIADATWVVHGIGWAKR